MHILYDLTLFLPKADEPSRNGKAMGQTDEGGRCPFLLENDDSKIVICMCNYYSLGQAPGVESLPLHQNVLSWHHF